MKKFTDRQIQSLKPKTSRYEVWEGGTGLGLRISPKGRKSWIFVYRFDGRARRMTLGAYPQVTVGKAHEIHGKALRQLEQGIDPGELRVEDNRDRRGAPTVRDLVDTYIEKWAKPRKRSWKNDQNMLEKDVITVWGRKKARDITNRDVIRLLDEVVARGAPIQANRLLATLRKMFNFAVSRGMIGASPCASVIAPSPENERDRILSHDEIRSFWNNLENAEMDQKTRLALKLQLVTGQRKGEIVSIKKDEIDLDKKIWTIPKEKSKNRQAHEVPLSALAVDLIKQAAEIDSTRKEAISRKKRGLSEESEWLFPSPRNDTHMGATALNHAIKRNIKKLKAGSFVPHDLRRTAASNITEMGTNRFILSKILNHAEKDVTAIYDRHHYETEKRKALDDWSSRLKSITSGRKANVIRLKRA